MLGKGSAFLTLWHLIIPTPRVTTKTEINGNRGCENLKHLFMCECIHKLFCPTQKGLCGQEKPPFFGASFWRAVKALRSFCNFDSPQSLVHPVFLGFFLLSLLKYFGEFGELPNDNQVSL